MAKAPPPRLAYPQMRIPGPLMQTSWALREGGLSQNPTPRARQSSHSAAARPRYHDDGQGCASVSQETPRSGQQQRGVKNEDQSALAPPTDAHAAIATGA